MILTKEQQERMVDEYIKKNGFDENHVNGFIDGMNAMVELINEVSKEPKYGKHYSFNSK